MGEDFRQAPLPVVATQWQRRLERQRPTHPPGPRLHLCRWRQTRAQNERDQTTTATTTAATTTASFDTANVAEYDEVTESLLSKLAEVADRADDHADDQAQVSGLTPSERGHASDETHEAESWARRRRVQNERRREVARQYRHHRPRTRPPQPHQPVKSNQVVPIGNNTEASTSQSITTRSTTSNTNETSTTIESRSTSRRTTTTETERERESISTKTITITSTSTISSANCDHHRDISSSRKADTPNGSKWRRRRSASGRRRIRPEGIMLMCQLRDGGAPSMGHHDCQSDQGDSWSRWQRRRRQPGPIPLRPLDDNDGSRGPIRCCCFRRHCLLSGGTAAAHQGRETSPPQPGNGPAGLLLPSQAQWDDEPWDKTSVGAHEQASWRKRKRRRTREEPNETGGCAPVRATPSAQRQHSARLWPHTSSNSWWWLPECRRRSSNLLTLTQPPPRQRRHSARRATSPNRIDLTNGLGRFQGGQGRKNKRHRHDHGDKRAINRVTGSTLSAPKSIHGQRAPSTPAKPQPPEPQPQLRPSPSSMFCPLNRGPASGLKHCPRLRPWLMVLLLIGLQLLAAPSKWPGASAAETSLGAAASEPLTSLVSSGELNFIPIEQLTTNSSRFLGADAHRLTTAIQSPATLGQHDNKQAAASSLNVPLLTGLDAQDLSPNAKGNQTGRDCDPNREEDDQEDDQDDRADDNLALDESEPSDTDESQDDYNDFGTYVIYESPIKSGAVGPSPSSSSANNLPDSDSGLATSSRSRPDEKDTPRQASGGAAVPEQSTSTLSFQRVFFAAKSPRLTSVDDDDNNITGDDLSSRDSSLRFTSKRLALDTNDNNNSINNNNNWQASVAGALAGLGRALTGRSGGSPAALLSSASSSSASLERTSDMIRSGELGGAKLGVADIQNGPTRAVAGSLTGAEPERASDSSSNIITTSQQPSTTTATKRPGIMGVRRHSSGGAATSGGLMRAPSDNQHRRQASNDHGIGNDNGHGASGTFGPLTGADPWPSSLSKQQRRHNQRWASSSSTAAMTSQATGDMAWRAALNGSTSLTLNSFNIDNDYHHEALDDNKPPASAAGPPLEALSKSARPPAPLHDDDEPDRSALSDLMEQQGRPLDSAWAPAEALRHDSSQVNNRVVDDRDNHRRESDGSDAAAVTGAATTHKDNHQPAQTRAQAHGEDERQHQLLAGEKEEPPPLVGRARSPTGSIHGHKMKDAPVAFRRPDRQAAPSQSGQPGVRLGRRALLLAPGRRRSVEEDNSDTIRASADLSAGRDRARSQPGQRWQASSPTGDNDDDAQAAELDRQQLDEDDIRWLNKINENAAKLAASLTGDHQQRLAATTDQRATTASAPASWAPKPARALQGRDGIEKALGGGGSFAQEQPLQPARPTNDTAQRGPGENMDERAVNLESVQTGPSAALASIYSNLLDWFKPLMLAASQADSESGGHGAQAHHEHNRDLHQARHDAETKATAAHEQMVAAVNELPPGPTGQQQPVDMNLVKPGGGGGGVLRDAALLEETATFRNQDHKRHDVAPPGRANATNYRGPHHDDRQPTATTHNIYYWRLIWVVLPLGATFGNLLVILAVYRERSLQSVTNYFIVSLAFADLFVGLVVMPFAVYVLVNEVWELSDLLCDIFVAVDVTSSTASILNLVAISIDRYLAIAHPIAYSASSSSTRAIFTICLVWLISCCVGAPIILGLNTTPERQSTLCIFYNSTFIFWSSLTSFYVPCLIMIGLYYRIFLAIRSRTKKVMIHHQPQGGATSKADAGRLKATVKPAATPNSSSEEAAAAADKKAKSIDLNKAQRQQQQLQVGANLEPDKDYHQQEQQQGQLQRGGSLARRQVQTFEAKGEPGPEGAQPGEKAARQDISPGAANETTNRLAKPQQEEEDVTETKTLEGEQEVHVEGGGSPEADKKQTFVGDPEEPDQLEGHSECLVITQLLKQEQRHREQDQQEQQHHHHCCHHHHHHHHHARTRSIEANDDCDGLDDDDDDDDEAHSHLSDSLCYNSRSNDDDIESTRSSQSSMESSHYDCSLAQPHNHILSNQRLNSTSGQQHQRTNSTNTNANESPRGGHRNSCCQTISPVVTSATICSDCQLQLDLQPPVGATKLAAKHGSAMSRANEHTQMQLQCSLTTPTSISWTSTRKRSSLLSSTYCCDSHATSTRCGHSFNTSVSCECPTSTDGVPLGRCGQGGLIGLAPGKQLQSPRHSDTCHLAANHNDAQAKKTVSPSDSLAVGQHQSLGMLESARLTIKRRSMKLTQILRGRSKESGNHNHDQQDLDRPVRLIRAQTEVPTTAGTGCGGGACNTLSDNKTGGSVQNGVKERTSGGSPLATASKLLKCAMPTTTDSDIRYSHGDLNTTTDGHPRTTTSSSQSTSAIRDDGQHSSGNQIIIDQPSSERHPSDESANGDDTHHRLSSICMPEAASEVATSAALRQSLLPTNTDMTTSERSTTITASTTTTSKTSSSSDKLHQAAKLGPSMTLASAKGQLNNLDTARPCDQGLLVSKLMTGVVNLVSMGSASDKTDQVAEVRVRPMVVPNDKQVASFGQQAVQKRLQPQQQQLQPHHHHRGNSRRRREKNAARRERKATKTLAIVLGIFLICWTPFFTCNIIDGICIQLNIDCRPGMSVYLVTSWLGYINSCVNPIIYTIFNMEFRRAFKKILTTRPECPSCCG